MNDKTASRSGLKKYLWQLAFAKTSTDQAKKACEFVINSARFLDGATYEALVNGIFILYSKPFGWNKGVGRLPEKFGKFKAGRLQNTHKMILSARDRFVAHNDATFKYCDEKGMEKEELLKLELMVSFGADGMAEVRTQIVGPQLALGVIPAIKSLCDELLGKLGAEESLIIKKLFENRRMLDGLNRVNIFDED